MPPAARGAGQSRTEEYPAYFAGSVRPCNEAPRDGSASECERLFSGGPLSSFRILPRQSGRYAGDKVIGYWLF